MKAVQDLVLRHPTEFSPLDRHEKFTTSKLHCDVASALFVHGLLCSVLQCVVVRCSALQCVAVRCSALQCVAVRFSALQCVVFAQMSPVNQWLVCDVASTLEVGTRALRD